MPFKSYYCTGKQLRVIDVMIFDGKVMLIMLIMTGGLRVYIPIIVMKKCDHFRKK
jgi:hypothetical protein